MSHIEQIRDKQSLFSFRDRVAKALKNNLDIALKQRKLDELTAEILGARNFNTALSQVSANDIHSAIAYDPQSTRHQRGWYRLLNGLIDFGYLDAKDIQGILEQLLVELYGFRDEVIERLSNAGLESQIQAIDGVDRGLERLRTNLISETGLQDIELITLLSECENAVSQVPSTERAAALMPDLPELIKGARAQ